MRRSRTSKVLFWAIAVLIIALTTLFIWQRSIIVNYGERGGDKPHASVKKIVVHDIGEDRIYMTISIMVSNPLLIELKADRLQYTLLVDSVQILETDLVKPVNIKALDSIMLAIPVEVHRNAVTKVMDRFERHKADSADYTLKGKLYFELPVVGEKTYVVNKTQRGPAFRLLTLETDDVDIEKFGLRNSDISMSLVVGNPNVFEIAIRDVDYDLYVGKDFHLDGEVKKVITIPARSTISLPLQMDVHTKNIARLTWQVLFEKKDTPFNINFICRVAGTDDTFKDAQLTVKRSGTLADLKQAFPKKEDKK